MSISEIKEVIAAGGGVLLALSLLVEFSSIKINPWSWLRKLGRKALKAFGRAINGEVIEKVNNLETKIDLVDKKTNELADREEEKEAVQRRSQILRFGDEILRGVKHSKEHFDQILLDITAYERYCETHPHFPNHVTTLTTKNIESTYTHLLETNGFL